MNLVKGKPLRLQIFFHAILGIVMLFVLQFYLINQRVSPQLRAEVEHGYLQTVHAEAALFGSRMEKAASLLRFAQTQEQADRLAALSSVSDESMQFARVEQDALLFEDGRVQRIAEQSSVADLPNGVKASYDLRAHCVLLWLPQEQEKIYAVLPNSFTYLKTLVDNPSIWVISPTGESSHMEGSVGEAPQPPQGGSVIWQQGDRTGATAELPGTGGWRLCVSTPSTGIYQTTDWLVLKIWAVWAILIIGAMIFAVCFAFKVDVPINKLTVAMQNMDPEHHQPIEVPTQIFEIERLTESFNQMQDHIHLLLGQVVVEQQLKEQAERRALQAQINPHFLYNTLDTIAWKAMDYGAGEISDIISALSTFFRISLSDGKDFITWDEEVEHVHSYLFIQQIRYEDKLDFNLCLDRSIRTCTTIKLLLQPLVENALYHGIKLKEGRGRIDVSVTAAENKTIRIIVQDDGVGMDEKSLYELRHTLQNGLERGGYGLRNLAQRLRLTYGPQYSLKLESSAGQGMRIEIIVPQMGEECEENASDDDSG